MILSDACIKKYVNSNSEDVVGFEIAPYNPNHVEANGYDLTLSNYFLTWKDDVDYLDPSKNIADAMEKRTYSITNSIRFSPGQMMLGCSLERVRIPTKFCGIIHTRSSIARLGLVMHLAAGDLDPGFNGQITFEIINHNPHPVFLPLGIRVAKLVLMELCCVPEKLYTGRYQGQEHPQASRLWSPS